MTPKALTRILTSKAMSARLGVGATAISKHVTAGKFPASWFVVLKAMADEAGQECPLCLFDFRQPVAPPSTDGGDVTASRGLESHMPAIPRAAAR